MEPLVDVGLQGLEQLVELGPVVGQDGLDGDVELLVKRQHLVVQRGSGRIGGLGRVQKLAYTPATSAYADTIRVEMFFCFFIFIK